MKMTFFSCLVLATLVGVGPCAPASLSIAPAPTGDRLLGRLQGINGVGQIVGQTIGGERATSSLYDHGTLTEIHVPGSDSTLAYGIESNGRVVGYYTDPKGRQHGFLYFRGAYTTMDIDANTVTLPQAINDAGRIVGYEYTSAGTRGFLYNGSTYTTIFVPGSKATYAYGINNSGEVVGYYIDGAGQRRGFHYDSQGALTQIDAPGARDTFVYGINNKGTIVGTYLDVFARSHGFAYNNNGAFTTIDVPGRAGATGTLAKSINDLGQIVLDSRAFYIATFVP